MGSVKVFLQFFEEEFNFLKTFILDIERNDTRTITTSILKDTDSDFLAAIVIGFASAIIIILSLVSSKFAEILTFFLVLKIFGIR